MSFWRNFKATVFSTWGYRKFISRHYEKAIPLFEKAIVLGTDPDIIRISYAYLSRSYVILGRFEDALSVMPRADELYDLESNDRDDFNRNEYKAFLDSYSLALRKLGFIEKADNVSTKSEQIIKKS